MTRNDPSTADLEDLLRTAARELGGPELPPTAVQNLTQLAHLVASWTERIDLTAHRTPADVLRRLILDALALDAALPSPLDSLADVGSGAGFPGLPIAILHPTCRVTLIESRAKRHHFQRMAVRTLGLQNVEPLLGRAEALPPVPHAAAVAQAAGAADRTLSLLLPWVMSGGLLILPGGERPPSLRPHPEVLPLGVRPYTVPLGGRQRSLWLGRRL